MEASRSPAADRARGEREAAARRRKTSVRLGMSGLILLFAGGIGTFLFLWAVVPLLALMGVGMALLVVAFVLVRTPIENILQSVDR